MTEDLKKIVPDTLRNWEEPDSPQMKKDVSVDCGWGKLIFGQTFNDADKLAKAVVDEEENKRNIAFYVRDPHVLISVAPQRIFLDPSHTYRLWFDDFEEPETANGIQIRKAETEDDADSVRKLLLANYMIPPDTEFILKNRNSELLTFLLAVDNDGKPVGTILAVDHVKAFDDPEMGCSIWELSVDPSSPIPGVGKELLIHVIRHFMSLNRKFVDLSVMHDNRPAIALYQKMGFKKVPVFCIKSKNKHNEALFSAPQEDKSLNSYSQFIVDEARKRGILVEVLDAENDYYKLSFGGRTAVCRESLTDQTTGIAMSRCIDKAATNKLLGDNGIRVPKQIRCDDKDKLLDFMKDKKMVIKPRRGERGKGVHIDVSKEDLDSILSSTYELVAEEMVPGQDVRVLVIDGEVVAAGLRKPPAITGNGKNTIRELIEKLSRRRESATGGICRVPMDEETKRRVRTSGRDMDEVLPEGVAISVRSNSNLRTGGTMHDITEELNQKIKDAALKIAKLMQVPVAGIDMIVPDITQEEYACIEVGERPNLTSHEQQPTARRFVDFLFPQSRVE